MQINGTTYDILPSAEKDLLELVKRLEHFKEERTVDLVDFIRTYYITRIHRNQGKTTRVVDAAIQTLFMVGEVTLYDHHRSEAADRHAASIMQKRLSAEHPSVVVRYDKATNKFSIKPEKA